MPIELTTGTPGAGKTLYTVSMILKPYADEGKRRLCIGGIPDLLLPHEVISVPTYDPEHGAEPSDGRERLPGQPPLEDVEMSAANWWQWCMPGDVIVIDECQRLFRPMASGRKAPMFVRKLETHRHYGVDFVVITQHPQLVHANLRALVGKHRHVRRLFGGSGRMVYEWDRCSSIDRTRDATATPWRGRKWAYELYKSSELHTKQSFTIPLPLIVFGLALCLVVPGGYFAFQRIKASTDPARIGTPVEAAEAQRLGITVAQLRERKAGAPAPVPAASAPALAAVVPVDAPASDTERGRGAGEPASTAPAHAQSSARGCIADSTRCRCFEGGRLVDEEPKACRDTIGTAGRVIPLDDTPWPASPWFPSPQRLPTALASASTIDHPEGVPPTPQVGR